MLEAMGNRMGISFETFQKIFEVMLMLQRGRE